MYKVKINDGEITSLSTDFKKDTVIINNQSCLVEFHQVSKEILSLKLNGKTYEALLLKYIPEEKTLLLKINQNKYSVQLKDKYDELLSKLGLDLSSSKKYNNVKAPMPGLVLNILIKEGEAITKGEPLIVLEAMKMENIIKAPNDAIIKKVLVMKGNSVEKNQLLIEFA